MREADYFSLDNLNELCGVEDHLKFAECLIDKYGKKSGASGSGQEGRASGPRQGKGKDDWCVFRMWLEQIRQKQRDKKLNLSVIGEFSTGKSTFINALLGRELLASGALQGTTVVSTVIDYSKHCNISLRFLDGRPEQAYGFPDSCIGMQKAIRHYTANASVARKLRSVRVGVPAEILENKIRIIDTPGTNVTEAWHEDVTVRTLKEESDLSIVLISAEKPASDTLLHFVKKYLESILPQCAFVVTKLDMIRPKERQSLLSYIKMKLEGELGLKNALVLPYISPMVLEDAVSKRECTEPEIKIDPSLLELSWETEKRLLEHTARQRTIAQTKKLLSLIDIMYQSISSQMRQISESYQSSLKLLERTKQADLESFVREEKRRRLGHFRKKINGIRLDLEETVYSMAGDAKNSIVGGLDSKPSIDTLKAYINGPLGKECCDKANEIISIAERYCSPVKEQFKKEMCIFRDSFRGLYHSLAILPIDMAQPKYHLPPAVQVENANLSSAASYIAQEVSSENTAFFGGMAAGAAVGTMIMPGVGTVIGGLLGFFGGGAVAPETDKVRENCKNKLLPQLDSYYRSVCDSAISAIDSYIKKIGTCLSQEIDLYLQTYRNEVDRQIRGNERQKAVVLSRIQSLKKDMSSIQARKKSLGSVIEQLNYLGRKESCP